MQACLYKHLFYEWTIWRMPCSEMKHSGIELAFRLIDIRRMPNMSGPEVCEWERGIIWRMPYSKTKHVEIRKNL